MYKTISVILIAVLSLAVYIPLTAYADSISLYPTNLVFSSRKGTVNPAVTTVNVLYNGPSTIQWAGTVDVPWLIVTPTNGTTPGSLSVSVNPTGLAPGVHAGTIIVNAPGASNSQQKANVNLVVKQNGIVQVSTWKNAYRGALSISMDDSNTSCFSELQSNGFNGTYFLMNALPPTIFITFYKAGMELGSHTVNHFCRDVEESILRYQEIKPNIQSICTYTPEPCEKVISFAWPCGETTKEIQAVTADYFLSARGYGINMLEEITPANFQNLNSYNSHEHTPYPPADLKTVVDMAEQQGKWANLVFHTTCNDDGAINYALTKDVWVAPIGIVVKYIIQRDRFILNSCLEASDSITFSYSRLAISSSPVRSFETAFGPEDRITLEVQINNTRSVSSITLDGISQPYTVITINGNKIVLINAAIGTTTRTITVFYTTPPLEAMQGGKSGLPPGPLF